VLWGSNARETHPIFFHHVLKAVQNGARLIVVDPRRTTSAEWADLWLGIDVGSDIALSNAVAREILAGGLENGAFVERATEGFEAYRDSVQEWTLERGEQVTGVPADAIRELAHAYAKADRAILCWTLGITEHHNAVDNVLALINLGLLTGHVGRYGSGLNPLRGQNNVQGGGDMGALPNKLPGFQDVEEDAAARERRIEGAVPQGRPLRRLRLRLPCSLVEPVRPVWPCFPPAGFPKAFVGAEPYLSRSAGIQRPISSAICSPIWGMPARPVIPIWSITSPTSC